jgi:hypothetical protein
MTRAAMRPNPLLLGSVLALLLATPAAGQVTLEARGGGTVGNYHPAAAGLETVPGPTVTGALELAVARFASLYLGLTGSRFGCEEGFCAGQDVSVTSRGLAGGVRVHPPRLPWVRVGLLSQALRIDGNGERESVGPAIGYELGGGLTIPVAGRVRVLPGIAYRAAGDADRASTLSAELGLQLRLGRLR